jgi:hypothetical protein
VASVPFWGRAGTGGNIGDITLSRLDDGATVDIERRLWRDELAFALEAPIWDRYGTFAGQPLIRATVIWTAADQRTVIRGERGGERFEEAV